MVWPCSISVRLSFWGIGVMLLGTALLDAQSTCGNVGLSLTPDYQFALGTSGAGSGYALMLNGRPFRSGSLNQLDLFHFDGSLASTSGLAPSQTAGTTFGGGKWGKAVGVGKGGVLAYPVSRDLSLQDGTIELWISPLFDGSDSIYLQAPEVLFQYDWGADANQLVLALNNSGGFFAGAGPDAGVSSGSSGIATWKAGDWHHLAFTYSTTQGRVRLYIDGALVIENNTSIQLPANGSSNFTVGSDSFGNASHFLIDELRISSSEASPAQIQYDVSRATFFANNEVVLSLDGLAPGQLTYSVAGCGAAAYTYPGVPINNVNPQSNLLPPGATSVNLSFTTLQTTACGYSVGVLQDYAAMQPFSAGQGTTSHQGAVSGLSSNPQVLNTVYLRCASNPDYVQTLEYRSVAALDPPFPRIGNIWWGRNLFSSQPDLAAQTSLFLAPDFTVSQLSALRAVNPNVLALPSLGSTYTPPPSVATTPDSYLLKDIHGNPIEIWPSTPPMYLLNMTKPEVAEWAANNLFQQLQQSNFGFDGVFLDSFSTTVSGLQYDAHGNPIQIDSNGDGIPDNPAALDAAWKAGMLHEIDTLRQLAPYAYISCHCSLEPDTLSRFNGSSLQFQAVDVREGRIPFSSFWDTYNGWSASARTPVIVNVEDSPPNQLAYGYGQPIHNMPPAVAEFGQTFYPNMRFGLAATLMNDGFFYHAFGDAGVAVNWWYDEYDFQLGYPLAPASQVSPAASPNLLANAGFEQGLGNWTLLVNNAAGARATVAPDTSIYAEGAASAHLAVSSVDGTNWHIDMEQDNLAFTAAASYRLQFWARADTTRTITVISQGGAPNFAGYGLMTQFTLSPSWNLYTASFIAPITATDGRLEFLVGDSVGNVWIDAVQLSPASSQVYRRDFTLGVALLNGTSVRQTIPLEPGLQRFSGNQAPKYQYIIDDLDTAASFTGSWNTVTYDSGVMWDDGPPTNSTEATGPYYHAWNAGVHQLDASVGAAQWALGVPEDGQYAIQVWLPAAPNANTWTRNAVYEVVSNGAVIASVSLDQTSASAGDGWRSIATVNLTAVGSPFLRVHNGGSGSLIADAVYITSAARYNDGSMASQVTLAPFDGILIQRQHALSAPASHINSVVNAASFQPAIASAGFVSIFGTGFASSARSWTSSDFSGTRLPLSLDGVFVTINGKPAYVEYISPTQINAIAPDDDTIGPVQVGVSTPQGASYSGTVLKQKLSPALFTMPSGSTSYAAALHLDGTLVGPSGASSRPAAVGEVIELYGTGFGPTATPVLTSQLVSQPTPLALPASVSVGGVPAKVQWAGLVASGLYQLNVIIPSLAAGDQPVQVSVGGFQIAPNSFVRVGPN
jgi:uncharacterized protein (TIGR03437 family)